MTQTYNRNTTTAEFGNRNQAVADLQKYLNTKGANLKVDSMYGPLTQEAVKKYGTPPATTTNVSKLESPVPATNLRPTTNVNLPTVEAPDVYKNYTTSLASNVDTLRKNLETTYKTQSEDLASKREKLMKEQKQITKEMNPEERATYEQENRIKQQELNAAEVASGTLQSDFMKRRKLSSELENLLNQSNSLIAEEKGMPLAQRVVTARTANTLSDIASRTGVIEATFSALDGNITQSYNLIDKAKETVSADWQDKLTYYDTLLDLNKQGLLDIDTESKDIAQKQVGLLESDLKKVTETSDYIKELMIDPESAQFLADSGVKLTDSIEQINTKLATQSKAQQIIDTKNEMIKDGYTYIPFPSSTAGLVSITAGDKTLWFKPEVKAVTTIATKTKGGASVNILTPTNKTALLGAGLTLDEINQIQNDVANYGLEEALKGIEDKNVIQTLREIYGTEAETPEDNETYLRENLTTKELKKLADWAKVSKWWRGRAKDIKQFFSIANADTLSQIKSAVEQGYTIDEIIEFLEQ